MEIKLYILILVYFTIGGVSMIFITKNKETAFRKKNWLKYFVYLVIMNLLFVSIIFDPILFHYLAVFILVLGFYEISRLIYQSKKLMVGFISLILFFCFAIVFYQFSFLPQKYLFYTLFITMVFDSFSQLSGQLFGKNKLPLKISPNKTYQGLAGGLLTSILTSILIRDLLSINIVQAIFLGAGFSGFAFIGDLLASYCKRKFNVKDFSRIIPGHGGVLDRFDSLLPAAAFMYLILKL